MFHFPDFVSGRNDSCFAITEDGAVYSWGHSNKWGQLGHATKDINNIPKKVGGPLEGKFVIQLTASECHILALTKDGEIYGWGRNDKKQLFMDNSTLSLSVPIHIFQI
jgi:E3 ubiquitin-protein ligase HERC2